MEPPQRPDKPARGIASVGTTETLLGARAGTARQLRLPQDSLSRQSGGAGEINVPPGAAAKKTAARLNVQLLEKEYSGVAVQAICKGYVKRIRFHSKNDALQKLMTHLGLLETDHSGVAVQVNSKMTSKLAITTTSLDYRAEFQFRARGSGSGLSSHAGRRALAAFDRAAHVVRPLPPASSRAISPNTIYSRFHNSSRFRNSLVGRRRGVTFRFSMFGVVWVSA